MATHSTTSYGQGAPPSYGQSAPPSPLETSSGHLQLIAECLEKLTTSTSHHDVLDYLYCYAKLITNSHNSNLLLSTGQQLYFNDIPDQDKWGSKAASLVSLLTKQCSYKQSTLVIEDMSQDLASPELLASQSGIMSLLMVPTGKPSSGKAIGFYWQTSRQFPAHEILLLETLARAGSNALERVSAQAEQLETNESFRVLVENMAQAVWETDPNGYIVKDSPSWRAYTGQSLEEMLGMGWLNAVHPEDRQYVETKWQNALGAQKPANAIFRINKYGDGWRWTNVRASPIRKNDGFIKKWVGINLDITELRETEEKLKVSSERLELAVEGSGDGVWEWDLTSNKSIYSPRLKALLGYRENEAVEPDEDWQKRIHPDDLLHVQEDMTDALTGATPFYKSEFRIRRNDGTYLWIFSRGIVVERDDSGKPIYMTGMASDISERKVAEEKIWHFANFDVLTGLPNRRMFKDKLEYEIQQAHRTTNRVALLFIDLDKFKEVNDLLGHSIGDLLLREAAQRIKSCVRQADTVARLGGDEFTVILNDLNSHGHVEQVAQTILDCMTQPFGFKNESAYISASIGITIFPDDATCAEELIRKADQALYVAKNAGRNQFSYFTKLLDDESHFRLRLINDLRKALGGKQLEIHYQPVVDLQTGEVIKAEALVRWQHPEFGPITPSTFIPLAEESGLINGIGDWVLLEAASVASSWSKKKARAFQISINQSPIQFMTTDSKGKGSKLTSETASTNIAIEITEGLLLHATPQVYERLLAYKDAGVEVALDDFGTGYSSMSYLKQFDIDYLKIDQSFIKDMEYDENNRTIAESIILMAHRLGLKVIAEGIETKAQQELLQEARCDFGQGFLYAQAMPAEEFEKEFIH